MMTFDSPVANDILYIKVKGEKGVQNVSLCEVSDGDIDKSKTSDTHIVLLAIIQGKAINSTYTRKEFLDLLNLKLAPMKVIDFAILPEGEMMVQEVSTFLEKYS
jgi:hypothetical protein